MSAFVNDVKSRAHFVGRSPGSRLRRCFRSLALAQYCNLTLTTRYSCTPLPVRDPRAVLELYTVDHVTATAAPNWSARRFLIRLRRFPRENEVLLGVAGSRRPV